MNECKLKFILSDGNINKICRDLSELSDEKLYREIVGSWRYAMTTTRSDLCFLATKLSQFMRGAYEKYKMLVKHVLR